MKTGWLYDFLAHQLWVFTDPVEDHNNYGWNVRILDQVFQILVTRLSTSTFNTTPLAWYPTELAGL